MLQGPGQRLDLLLLQVVCPTELCKASDDKMANLAELRVARHQEHVTRDSIHQHLLACDAIIAEGKEDPADIGVDLGIVDATQCVK